MVQETCLRILVQEQSQQLFWPPTGFSRVPRATGGFGILVPPILSRLHSQENWRNWQVDACTLNCSHEEEELLLPAKPIGYLACPHLHLNKSGRTHPRLPQVSTQQKRMQLRQISQMTVDFCRGVPVPEGMGVSEKQGLMKSPVDRACT